MKKSISDKIEECRLASIEPFEKLLETKTEQQRQAALDIFLSKTKYIGKKTFVELWAAYGLTDTNVRWLNGLQNHNELYRLRYNLMEKWVSILFDGTIAFKPFFDIEIEKHKKIRSNAKKIGISHISLIVKFENIAQHIDDQFISIYSTQVAINTANGAVIKKPTAINQELITALLEINTNAISTSSEIRGWIKLVTSDENQNITNRLHDLNVFINSLKVVEKQIDNSESKAYLNGLNSQLLFSIHKTLDLAEWLCNANYKYLPIELKNQFDICRLEHSWKSSLSDS